MFSRLEGGEKKEKSEEEGCGVQDASKMRANFFLARRREMDSIVGIKRRRESMWDTRMYRLLQKWVIFEEEEIITRTVQGI